MLRTGTTSVIDHFPEQGFSVHDVGVAVNAFEQSGMRAVVALRIFDAPYDDTATGGPAIRRAAVGTRGGQHACAAAIGRKFGDRAGEYRALRSARRAHPHLPSAVEFPCAARTTCWSRRRKSPQRTTPACIATCWRPRHRSASRRRAGAPRSSRISPRSAHGAGGGATRIAAGSVRRTSICWRSMVQSRCSIRKATSRSVRCCRFRACSEPV